MKSSCVAKKNTYQKTVLSASYAFSLSEVLIVIVLLSVLISILFPVFNQVREKSRQINCTSNLRQIGIAFQMYKLDYDDHYPWAITKWGKMHPHVFEYTSFYREIPDMALITDVLYPYAVSKEIFRCPSDVGVIQSDLLPTQFAVLSSSYNFDIDLGLKGYTDANINTSRHYIAGDHMTDWHSYPRASFADLRGNVLYADGHVKMTFASDFPEQFFVY
jgi:prepilin-type processing-associated H-X9-DG protein